MVAGFKVFRAKEITEVYLGTNQVCTELLTIKLNRQNALSAFIPLMIAISVFLLHRTG